MKSPLKLFTYKSYVYPRKYVKLFLCLFFCLGFMAYQPL